MNNLIQQYGWQHYCHTIPNNHKEQELGRIQAVNKTNYEVITTQGIIKGEITGQLLYASDSEERPQTGDWVKIMPFNAQCIITEVLPRYSLLARKEAGKKFDKQIFAVNIDKAFIVQGLDRDYNPRRLERMVSALQGANIEPTILLNKVDIADDLEEKVKKIKTNLPGVSTHKISALTNDGIELIQNRLVDGLTYILVGSSGAGKSTLMNALLGNATQLTQNTSSAVGKGVHTTTKRELFVLPNGSLMIDTAGVREFGLALDDASDLNNSFTDIGKLAKDCYYTDCTHVNEPHCAVLKALEENLLTTEVYNSYIKLRSEAEHYSASSIDKKRKGKGISKLVRNMKRQNIKKRY